MPTYPQCLRKRNPGATFLASVISQSQWQILLSLQQTLEECGFNVSRLCAKCALVCPLENDDCCMAHILSKQDDFANQISVLETVIQEAGHECIFLLKFHCELNPIKMVSHNFSSLLDIFPYLLH
ncbi:hypothetical protein K443DRAFT_114001 [Laccaria amethystina LaAM-08-1]|uniref:Uncharacterized protein n=1 Tax=Laccaria amethystina LaAM-08-1 TaxID=1095629 RepID=A0A0C9X3A8_9AGAR|nr:hypothetical protein K443DRAFT_114001 [Laccaria amethystina LaAM-08-1]